MSPRIRSSRGGGRGVALHCAGEGCAERLFRSLQRAHARDLVNESLFFGFAALIAAE